MFVGNAGTQKAEIEGARLQAEAVVNSTKVVKDIKDAHVTVPSYYKFQDDLQKLGLRIKQHEDIIKFLRTQKNIIDESILNLQVTVGKYHASMKPVTEEEEAQSEDETYRNILKLEKSAAGLICQLKTRHGTQVSHSPLVKDVIGIVGTLGKVDDEKLGRLLAEYLGKNTMLALVCKTFDGVQAMESCDIEGTINRNSGLHGLGSSVGHTLDGRFLVICLDDLRPYVGKFIADDPQRRLDLLKPKLAGGEIPRGFLGYAVNFIYLNRENLSCVTTSGHGLRETLFYYLFSRMQVYRTRGDMMQALPFITDGALSLDGGIIGSPGVFHLGDREEPEVKFPRISKKSSLPGNYNEIEISLQSKKWNLERLLEDMRKEQSMLDQAKFNFEIKKQEFVRFLAQSSHYAPAQQQQQSPAGQESSTPKPKSSCTHSPVII